LEEVYRLQDCQIRKTPAKVCILHQNEQVLVTANKVIGFGCDGEIQSLGSRSSLNTSGTSLIRTAFLATFSTNA